MHSLLFRFLNISILSLTIISVYSLVLFSLNVTPLTNLFCPERLLEWLPTRIIQSLINTLQTFGRLLVNISQLLSIWVFIKTIAAIIRISSWQVLKLIRLKLIHPMGSWWWRYETERSKPGNWWLKLFYQLVIHWHSI